MKKINDFINEKLKVTKNSASDTTKIPVAINNADKVYLNKLYKIIQKKVLDEKIDEDGDLSSLVNFYKEYTKNDKKYQTKEMIWTYLFVVLGYDYMFDDSDDERRENGYLSELYDDADPIEEFVYRAAEWANNYSNWYTMRNLKDIILEKLKVTKSSGYKVSLKEFAKERQSLNYPKNYVKLTSNYKMVFINWVEKILLEDDVVDAIPIRGHILYFDGDILRDNIGHNEVDPVVSTELDLTWGEAYMRIVTYYVKNNIFHNCNILLWLKLYFCRALIVYLIINYLYL